MSATALMMLAIFSGLLAGVVALGLVLWLAPRPRAAQRQAAPETLSEPRQFVFRNRYLVEHSDNVGFLISAPVDHLKAWDDLIDALGDMADGLQAAFDGLQDHGRSFRLEGRFGRDRILILGVRHGEDLRITVASAENAQTSMRIDLTSLEIMERDAAMLARISDSAPILSWVADTEGRVIWSNASYAETAARCIGPDAVRGWPVVTLFPDHADAPPGTTRRQIVDRVGDPHWFEITNLAPDAQGLRHMHALSLDAVIAAEDSLRTFIQTLTKTFAYLPTGLAIFDRKGALAMFNPALMDMTGLDGSWLSRRPRLAEFFDVLRDHQKLPEPRDYKAWRDGLSDLSRVDAGGAYRETWTLPNGQTYCVTGRPQADGAVALMMEDVSAEVTASRLQREEREALISALGASSDALVVFGADGRRIAANPTAECLLLSAPDEVMPNTLEDCIAAWRPLWDPSPAWGDLRNFLNGACPQGDRVEWSDRLCRNGENNLTLRVVPVVGGGLTLCFAAETIRQAPQRQVADALS